jgi:hypothetical protein
VIIHQARFAVFEKGTTAACFKQVGKIPCELLEIENKFKNRY